METLMPKTLPPEGRDPHGGIYSAKRPVNPTQLSTHLGIEKLIVVGTGYFAIYYYSGLRVRKNCWLSF